MKTEILITQLVFNVNTLDWELHLHIRGCNTKVKITANEAESILHSVKQEPTEAGRLTIEHSKDKSLIYYIVN